MDARGATEIVREYFESIKKMKFIFDVRSVKFDEFDETETGWMITCDIQNVFDEEPISYKILVDDKTGDILDVEEIEE